MKLGATDVVALAITLSRQNSSTDDADTEDGEKKDSHVQGVVIYGALTGALILLFLIFVLILFLQRRRQRAHMLQLAQQQEEARRQRRRKKRRAGLRTYEIDMVAPEMVVGGDWESSTSDEEGAKTAEVSTVAKLGSVEEGSRKNGRPVVELDEEVLCSVCLDELSGGDIVRRLPCDHMFHSVCIHRWARRANKCPCCLQKIYHRRRKKSSAPGDCTCEEEGATADASTEVRSEARDSANAPESDNGTVSTQRDAEAPESELQTAGGSEISEIQSREAQHETLDLEAQRHLAYTVVDIGDDDTSYASLHLDRRVAEQMLCELRRELRENPEAEVLTGNYSDLHHEFSSQLSLPSPPPPVVNN